MLVVEYTKKYPLSAISHIDLLRVFQRIIRRTEIKVAYSQGFNPHMRIFFSPPTPLGQETSCEYVTIETDEKGDECFLKRFNSVCPMGIRATRVWQTQKNPNLAKMLDRAEYCLSGDFVNQIKIDGILDNPDYEIEYVDKVGQLQTQQAGEMIFDVRFDGENRLKAILSFGNKNLRADRFFKYLCAKNGVDFDVCNLEKIQAYVQDITVADFLADFC